MPVLAYGGRSAAGAVAGEIEANDRPAAVAQLRAKGVVATSVQERQAKAAAVKRIGGKVKDKDLAIYTRQFSTMVDAGLPIAQCLSILAEQGDSKALRDVTGKIGLDVVLQRLSGYIEKAAKLKAKVKGAMVYPLTIMGVAALVIIFMIIFVIPTFAKMFEGLGADLPLPTKVIMLLSEFTQKYILFMIGAIAAAIYGIKRYYNTDQGSKVIDAFLLRVPVLGMLIRKVSVARFTRTLGTLISSGVPILEGLLITARSAGNRVVEREVMQARTAVTSGRTLSEPLRGSTVFPPMVVHMINVGENTGALDRMLSKIADFYDDEVDTGGGAPASLPDPIMIVFLGIVVGGLVVAMYLPIFKLVTLMK